MEDVAVSRIRIVSDRYQNGYGITVTYLRPR